MSLARLLHLRDGGGCRSRWPWAPRSLPAEPMGQAGGQADVWSHPEDSPIDGSFYSLQSDTALNSAARLH